MVHLERIYQEYNSEGIEVAIALSKVDDYTRQNDLALFKSRFNVSYTGLADGNGKVTYLYKLNPNSSVPKTMIIDSDGIVRLVGDYITWAQMAEAVESILGKPEDLDLSTSEKAIELLKSQRHFTRWKAAQTLGEIGDKTAVLPLIEALSSESAAVREMAAQALGKIGDKRALEPLIVALDDKAAFIRSEVVAALGQLQDKRAIEPLVKLLADVDLQPLAASALVEINQPDLVSEILEKNRKFLTQHNINNTYWFLGHSYMQKKEYSAAIHVLEKAIAKIHDQAYRGSYQLDLGECYLNTGRYDEAIAAYEDIIKTSPDPMLKNLAETQLWRVYGKGKLYDRAVERYGEMSEANPMDAKAYLNLAKAYSGLREHEKAIAEYEKALEIQPGNAAAERLLWSSYKAADLYDIAVEKYEEMVKSKPLDAKTHEYLAKAYEGIGEINLAIAEYEKIIKIQPGRPEWYQAIGDLCSKRTVKNFISDNVLSLDGDGDYISIPSTPELQGGENVIKTVEAWFYMDGYRPSFPVVGKIADVSEKDWAIRVIGDGQIQFWAEVGGKDYRPPVPIKSALYANQWYHVAVVINRPERLLQLYLNGKLIVEDTDMRDACAATEAPVEIGFISYIQDSAKGYIDDVRIWNIARTQEEIQEAMNINLNDDEPGLVGYWQFDREKSGKVFDLSLSGNHGTIIGNAKIVKRDRPVLVKPTSDMQAKADEAYSKASKFIP